jgi:hypothetical protein
MSKANSELDFGTMTSNETGLILEADVDRRIL